MRKQNFNGLGQLTPIILVLFLVAFSLISGPDLLADDRQEDLLACYKDETGCSSCRTQTVAGLQDEFPFIDILDASVEKTHGGNTFLEIKLRLSAPLPSLTGSFTAYSIAMDLDGSSKTGFSGNRAPLGFFPDLGVDLWVLLSLKNGPESDFIFIGPKNIKNLNSTSGLLKRTFADEGKTIIWTVPVKNIERKLTFAYLHEAPKFKVVLEKAEWVAFTARATVQYPKENPICDFYPDKYFEESSEGCLLNMPD